MKRTTLSILTPLFLGAALWLTGCSGNSIQDINDAWNQVQAEKNAATLPETEEGLTDAFHEDFAFVSAEGAGLASLDVSFNTEEYSFTPENGWRSAVTSPFSTFAADVDTASYANLRRMILSGGQVVPDAVRIEEMINYFSYDYPEPGEDAPFSVSTRIAPCPWNEETDLLMIGLGTKKLDLSELPPSNLVFLVDISGSMDEPDKLPLVQRAFRMLAEHLRRTDRISLVTYAFGDEIILDGSSGEETAEITEAIEDLMAGGGTNGSAGIQTAYELARKHFIEGGNNRVILATDGDLNIGITDEGSLIRLIEEEASSGVALSVLGFGSGNLSDARMEALADHGNGNYSYIDSVAEARRVLVSEMGSTLLTVAKDVKLQVEFNPAKIKGYRLIGYENRLMEAEDFSDDSKDGGEIGAGHRMTALYEIAPKGSAQEIPEVDSRYASPAAKEETSGELLALNIRYKEPEEDESRLLVYPVDERAVQSEMDPDMSWAAGVAQAGMLLSESDYAGSSSYREISERLSALPGAASDPYRLEFLYLLTLLEREESLIS